MRTVKSLLVLIAGFLTLTVTAFAVPFPIPDEAPLGSAEQQAQTELLQQSNDFVLTPSAVLADTLDLFCPVTVFQFNSPGNDVWGWIGPDGTDYAIMGVYEGLAFVNVATFQVVEIVPFAQGCGWKDIKTYQHYAYAVSECISGMIVIDLQYLPDSVHYVRTVDIRPFGEPWERRTSHNLSIDTINGYAYAEGTGAGGASCNILSLADPENPVWVNNFGPSGGIHDMYVVNDIAYLAEGSNPYWSIWDVSNKNNPVQLVRTLVPTGGYIHTAWPTDDGRYLVTTEETGFHTVKFWNIENLANVQLVGEWLGDSRLAHNAQVSGNDRVYISHYESGVSIIDMSDPSNPFEISSYDTYPDSDNPAYNGTWGVFQYTNSGLIYASNMEGQLFILQEQQAVLADTFYIETSFGVPGSQVRVDISASNTLPIHQFIIPFSWDGEFNLQWDSASKVGLRTEYFEEMAANAIGSTSRSYRLTSTTFSNPAMDLPEGTGPILSLYFTIPWGVTGGPNPIVIQPVGSKMPLFLSSCLTYTPGSVDGAVSLSCCNGITGDIDGSPDQLMTILDVTFLVDYLFREGAEPECLDEANVDGEMGIDVLDITYLVAFLFQSGPLPVMCGTF